MPFKNHLRYTLQSLSFYAPSVITILLGYFILTKLSQGQDVVMLVGEQMSSFVFALIAVMLWAFFVWYCSRLIGYEKKFNDTEWPISYLSTFPRLLSYNAFVTVQASIFALPTIYNWSLGALLTFVALHNGFFFLLTNTFKIKRKPIAFTAIAIAIGYISFIASQFIYPIGKSDHQKHLPLIAILLFALQILYLYYFIRRRAIIDQNARKDFADDAVDYVTLLSINVIKVPAWFKEQEERTFVVFNIISGIAIFIYFVTVNSVTVATGLGSLAVVLLAFGMLAGLATIITYASMRARFNLFFILFVIAIIEGNFFDPYTVALTKTEKPYVYQQRPTLETYLKKWIDHRKEKIDSASSFPVYLILSDGGASRSGYWAASVLAAWQRESLTDSLPDTFSDHLLALSGASGGSVGNATFYGLLKTREQDSSILERTQNFLGHDFLTYTIAHYLGSDLAGHFIPRLRDRATALSNNMDYFAADVDNTFKQNVNEVVDTTGRLPILFINTTRVQEGTPAVVSSIKLNGFSERLDVLTLVDSTISRGYGNIHLSTAAVLGARFPYVSPAGSISYTSPKETVRNHYFVDGGYFDNSGAGVVVEMMQEIEKLKNNNAITDSTFNKLLKKLSFRLVHITNNPDSDTTMNAIHPLINELAAPLLTVFNTYNSQTTLNDKRAENLFGRLCTCENSYNILNLYRKGKNENYPMNWVISDYQRQRMDERVDEVTKDELKKFLKTK
jgi:hypothetical protein